MVGNPVKLSEVGMHPTYAAPPELGEHTEAILSEAGFSAEEITALRAAGVV